MTEGLFRSDQKVAGPEASGDPNQVHPSSPDIVRPKLTGIWLGPRLFINQSSRSVPIGDQEYVRVMMMMITV